MEIPPVVNIKGQQSLGLETSETQEVTSGNSSPSVNGSEDHRGDDCLPEAQSLLLESDEDRHNQRKRIVSVSENNTESLETSSSHEPDHLSVSPDDTRAESGLLASDQLHETGLVSASPGPTDNCCTDVTLPVSVAEGQSDPVVQNAAGQTSDFGCVTTNDESLEPVSNGHDLREDLYPIHNPDSSLTCVVHAAGPDSGPAVLPLPRIVKHKLSSITFWHYDCPSGADSHGLINESSDDGEYSLGYEREDDDLDDGDDGDVFKELPQSRELPVNQRPRSKDEQKRRGAVSARPETENTTRDRGYEAEGESSSKEVRCTNYLEQQLGTNSPRVPQVCQFITCENLFHSQCHTNTKTRPQPFITCCSDVLCFISNWLRCFIQKK